MAHYVTIALSGLKGLDILKKWFLPDKKHEEDLRSFRQLSAHIDQVRDDVKALERKIKWEIATLQYADVVNRITLGMQYCLEVGKGSGKAEVRYQERLKEICANQNFTLALNALLDGITGKGLFRRSILDEFYSETKGDRSKISVLANRLQQLVCGGMIVHATYETVMRGEEGAREITKQYISKLKEVNTKVQSTLGRCVEKFEENMKNDLNAFLDTGRPNNCLRTKISNFMSVKYDWLENFCLVYNDLHGFDQHCFNGFRVDSLHRSGKCGIVFHRPKGKPPKFSNRYDEAHAIVVDACKIIDGAWFTNAEEGFKDIVAKLSARGIGWIGCAVTTRNPDLGFGGTLSSKIVSVIGNYATVILLLQ